MCIWIKLLFLKMCADLWLSFARASKQSLCCAWHTESGQIWTDGSTHTNNTVSVCV